MLVSAILLVEDDPALRRALRTTLRSRDFEVLEAATGETAIVLAADRRADVVILDLGLPDLDGLNVLRRLRAFTDVPVIVLTARDEQSEKVRSLDAGADESVHLTRTELTLLEQLVRQPGKLLTQEYLLREVWGPGYGTESNYLRVY